MRRYGRDAMLAELDVWLSYVLMGAVLSVFLIFIWHMISWPSRLLDSAERERDELRSRLAVLSPLSIMFPLQANMPNKVTAFRQITIFLPDGKPIEQPSPSQYRFYIGVTNNTGRTIKDVGLRIVSASIPERPVDWRLLAKDTANSAIDIAPRLTELFLLGEIIRREDSHFAGSHRVVDDATMSDLVQQSERNSRLYIGLIVHHSRGNEILLRNDDQRLRVIAHGVDVEPAAAEVVLNMKGDITLEVRPVALSFD